MRMRGNTARGQLGEPRTAAAGVGILALILVPWDWNFVAGVYAARTARGESQLREMSGPRPRSKCFESPLPNREQSRTLLAARISG